MQLIINKNIAIMHLKKLIDFFCFHTNVGWFNKLQNFAKTPLLYNICLKLIFCLIEHLKKIFLPYTRYKNTLKSIYIISSLS